jgi:hypothetical protein
MAGAHGGLRLVPVCAVVAMLLLPGGAMATTRHHRGATESFVNEPEPPRAEFSAHGTNGYEIGFLVSRGEATILVHRGSDQPVDEAEASYDLLRGGSANGERVHANFGRVGLVSAHFVPSGRVERSRSPHCKGGPSITRFGTFVGKIRFEGEEGFTRFSSRRVRGTISSAPRQFCTFPKSRVVEPPPHRRPKFFLTGFFASAVTRETATNFVASVRELEPDVARFQASSFETHGEMLITREVAVEGPSTGFAFTTGLDSATLSPPAPFSGSATFTRIDDFASRWQGPLAVSLPGRANVPLTGRAFTWALQREEDPDDSVEGGLSSQLRGSQSQALRETRLSWLR